MLFVVFRHIHGNTRLVVAARSFILDCCLEFSRTLLHISCFCSFFASVWSARVLLFVLRKKTAKPQRSRTHGNTSTIPHTTVKIFLRFVVYKASVVLSVGYSLNERGPWLLTEPREPVVVSLLTPVFGAVVAVGRHVGATKIGWVTAMVFVLCRWARVLRR